MTYEYTHEVVVDGESLIRATSKTAANDFARGVRKARRLLGRPYVGLVVVRPIKDGK